MKKLTLLITFCFIIQASAGALYAQEDDIFFDDKFGIVVVDDGQTVEAYFSDGEYIGGDDFVDFFYGGSSGDYDYEWDDDYSYGYGGYDDSYAAEPIDVSDDDSYGLTDNPFARNPAIATDVSGAYVDQFGFVRPDTTQDALRAIAEGEDGSLVDITHAGADLEKISELKEQYLTEEQYYQYAVDQETNMLPVEDFNSWKVTQLAEPEIKKDFLDNMAASIFVGNGHGEVLLGMPGKDEQLDYYAGGIYDDKHHYSGNREAVLTQLPRYPGNANLGKSLDEMGKITVPFTYSAVTTDGKVLKETGTAVEVSPRVFITAAHNIPIHKAGDKITIGEKDFAIEKLVKDTDHDIAAFTLPGRLDSENDNLLRVTPFNRGTTQVGEWRSFYSQEKERETTNGDVKFPASIWSAKVLSVDGQKDTYTTAQEIVQGESGAGVYALDDQRKLLYDGTLREGRFKTYSNDEGEKFQAIVSEDSTYAQVEDVARLLQRLNNKYDPSITAPPKAADFTDDALEIIKESPAASEFLRQLGIDLD